MPSITTIEGLPQFVSSSEHAQITQTTPSSFDSLPPVCRLELEPIKIDGYPGWENLNLKLYLTEREVGFYSNDRLKTLVVPYPTISLHAISRTESSGQPCIYCQLEENTNPETEDETNEVMELKIIPEDSNRLEEIFEILSACAALHPSIMPAEEEEEGWFGETDEIEEQAPSLSETGRHTLNRLENLLDGWTPPDPDHPHTTTEPPMTNGNHHASPPASHEDDA